MITKISTVSIRLENIMLQNLAIMLFFMFRIYAYYALEMCYYALEMCYYALKLINSAQGNFFGS